MATKITSRVLADDAIVRATLGDDAIGVAEIADDAVTTAAIADDVALGGNPTTTTQSTANSTTRIATTAFVQAAIDTDISALIDSAPGTLNTLNEIAAALNDDPSFTTTVNNAIALKAPIANAVFTGNSTFDSPTLYVDGANNRVGVGTLSPNNLFTASASHTSYAVAGGGAFIEVARTSGADAGFLINKDTGQWAIGIDNSDGTNPNLLFEYDSGGSAHAGFTSGAQLAISYDGNVGIGTTSPSTLLHLSKGTTGSAGGGDAGITMTNKYDSPDNSWAITPQRTGVSNTGLEIRDVTDSRSVMSFDGTGNVGIGTASPSSYLATELVVATADEGGITLANSSTNHKSNIYFADGTSGNARNRGNVSYDHGTDALSFGTAAGHSRLVIDNAGAATFGGLLTANGINLGKAFGTSSIMIGDTTTGTINAANHNTGVGVDIFAALTSGDGNTVMGFSAGTTLNTGQRNVAIGWKALDGGDTASDNVMVGYEAGGATVDGLENTCIGYYAGAADMANYNTFVGSSAGQAATAANNTIIGSRAGDAVTSGAANTFIGKDSGGAVRAGAENVAVGLNALLSATNSDASNNTAIGAETMKMNTTGTQNTAVGKASMILNESGDFNTAIGAYSLKINTSADANTAIGYETLFANQTGTYGTAVGYRALKATTVSSNTAVGAFAGQAITSGGSNIAIGTYSLMGVCTGSYNVAVGVSALAAVTSGSENVAIGRDAMNDINTGSQNVAIGHESLTKMQSNSGTVAVGFQALENATSQENTAVGYKAGELISGTGQMNVCLGAYAGDSITTGYRNTILGQRCDVSTGTGAYQIAIGEDVIAYGQSTITVGSGSSTNRWWMNFTTNTGWARASDQRYKENITDNTNLGLAFINDLRPVTYNWKKKSEIDSTLPGYDPTDNADGQKGPPLNTKTQWGLIAQEVKAVIDDHGVTDFGGWDIEETTGVQGIAGEAFIHPLIKAVQELSAKLEAAEARIATLEG
jgi:hypothetical protein